MTRREKIDEILGWMKEAKAHVPNCACLLVANKTDLVQDRAVTEAEGKEMAEKFSGTFLETSVKMNENVEDVFKVITREIMKNAD